ncbi:MAG: hypothetical protein EZS28_031397, partial [Streblomastix strix]
MDKIFRLTIERGKPLEILIIDQSSISQEGLDAQSKKAHLIIRSQDLIKSAKLLVSEKMNPILTSIISTVDSLTLQNLIIDFRGYRYHQIFVHQDTESSKLTLDHITVFNGGFDKHIFLVDDGASIVVNNSKFESIFSYGIGGASIRVDIEDFGTAEFIDSEFSKNTVQKGYQGGALLVNIEADEIKDYSSIGTIVKFDNVTFSDNVAYITISYPDCTPDIRDQYQQSLFINLQGGNFVKAILYGLFKLDGINDLKSEIPHSNCFVHTYAGSDSQDSNIDLSMFVKDAKVENCFVNSKDRERASNEIWCGREFFPCSTLNQAVNHVSNTDIYAYIREEALINQTISQPQHSMWFIGQYTETAEKPRIYYNDIDFVNQTKPYLIISDAQLTIINLAFEISSQGAVLLGLIYKDNIEIIKIKSCNFYTIKQSISPENSTKGSLINVNNSAVNIEQCNFLNIKSGSDGVIKIIISDLKQKSWITESNFDNCETGNIAGGAINVDFGEQTDVFQGGFELKRIRVSNCRGQLDNNPQNSAIYFIGQLSNLKDPILIEGCYFKDNGGIYTNDSYGAHDLYFQETIGSDILNSNTIVDSYSNSYKQKIGGSFNNLQTGQTNFDFLLPDILEDIYVDVPEDEQTAQDGTGTKQAPFKNVNLAVKSLKESSIVKQTINIITNRSFDHKSVNIGNKTVIIIGQRIESINDQVYMPPLSLKQHPSINIGSFK